MTRLRLFHFFVIVVICCSTGFPSRAAAAGGDLIWYFPGIEDVHAIADIEDQNSDGVRDIILETYDAGASGDHLYCLSGSSAGITTDVIWSTKPVGGASSGGGYDDECLAIAPDITGDGVEDVLLGTAWGGRSAYVLHGNTWGVWYHFDTYTDFFFNDTATTEIYTIKPVPDTDDDFIPDLFFGCGSDNDGAYHVSPGDGVVLWYKNMGDAVFSCDVLDDVDGDHKADGVFGVGDNADAVWVMPGGPHSPVTAIWYRQMPGSVLALARVPDISGDNVNDVVAGSWTQSNQLFAFDGVNGDTLWIADLGNYNYVMKVVALDDVNDDGWPDVAVGTFDNVARVLSGIDGSLVWSDTVRTLNGGDIWAVGRVDDVTGDGINDVVAGSFDYRIYLYDGVSGDRAWEYNTGNRLYFVDGVPDISGNGVPDVVGGTQMLSASGGRGFLLEGGDPISTSVPSAAMAVNVGVVKEGVEVRLAPGTSTDYVACHVERLEMDEDAMKRAATFKSDLIASHKRGDLTTTEVITARRLTPGPLWVRLTDAALPLGADETRYLDRSALAGHTYSYRFVLVSGDGAEFLSPTATLLMPGDAVPRPALPRLTARPNPFNPATTIEFSLREAGPVHLSIFGTNGRHLADLLRSNSEAGTVSVEWDGRDNEGRPLPSGLYFARLEGCGFTATQKITIIR